MREDELGWYVYCVVGASAAAEPDLVGVGDRPVVAVREGKVAALGSRVAMDEFGEEPLRKRLNDLAWLEPTARAHERVLAHVARRTTVVPMRMCTIYRDHQGLREMLVREADRLGHALDQLAGRREWGVKAFSAGQASAGLAPDGSASDRHGDGAGAAYMRGQLARRREREDTDRRLRAACEAIHGSLSTFAAGAVSCRPQSPELSGRRTPMILNGAYLVDDDDREAFHDLTADLQGRYASLGVVLETTGPWAAYNFVPVELGVAS
ncbi:MAG: GvpL/GvpF family gas vesicle protein [Solirubrobacteraceae bacterium]